jgi:hypothetical protein
MRVMLVSCALATLSATVILAQEPVIEIPDAIKPAPGLSRFLTATATGVQIYTCGRSDAGTPAWIFKAPEAQLFDPQQRQIGMHYAGPTWEADDGGKVVGTVKASIPAPGGTAIPWLLLDVTSREGAGLFTGATAILRILTVGGLAPAQGCAAAQAGGESRVPYTAMYQFLK